MLNRRLKCKAQSITEYVILIALITAALSGMTLYMRRGIQAGIKVVADELGSQQDDPQKGTKSDSLIHSYTRGAQIGTPASQRVRILEDGSVKSDFERTTTTQGTATYKSEREE